jgi:hypothetical protein
VLLSGFYRKIGQDVELGSTSRNGREEIQLSKVSKGTGILLILLIFGSIFGSLLGEILSGSFPWLTYGRTVGLSPTTIDLAALTVTFGLILKLNIATIIGFFLAFFIYTRL